MRNDLEHTVAVHVAHTTDSLTINGRSKKKYLQYITIDMRLGAIARWSRRCERIRNLVIWSPIVFWFLSMLELTTGQLY